MLSKSFNFTPGSRMETLAALIPFILFSFLFGALTPLFNFLNRFAPLPNWLMAAFAFSLLGLLVIFLLIGLVKGLPRWALPYLGVALSFFSVYTFGSWLEYNILENPYVSLHLEIGDQAIILEGVSQPAGKPEPELANRLAAEFRRKYTQHGYSPEPNHWDEGGLYVFTPRQCLAWTVFFESPAKFILED